MRVIKLDNMKPGLIVARPILDKEGRTLLHQNVMLTDEYIGALRAKGYDNLYVRDPDVTLDVPPEEDITPATRAKAFHALREVYDSIGEEVAALKLQSYQKIQVAFESDAIRQIISHKGPLARIHEIISSILDEVLSRQTLAGLSSIRSHDTKLFEHSIDVCVIGSMVGRAVGLDQHHLRQLATGSLLHDIGKIFIDTPSDRAREIRQHTQLGYELLKHGEDPDILSPHVALEHHEHQDGTGLPRGTISSNSIERNRSLPAPIPTLVGEICAVANFYDNALNGVDQPQARNVEEALRAVRDAAGTRLNRAVVNAFLKVVPVYPIGTEVVLTGKDYNNFRGIVYDINPGQLDRPRVVLIRDNAGNPLQEPVEVDLSQDEAIGIR
jgi:HD-GYP domain-containing protein (c-di-GMP phosphodiesterase class II)